MAKSFEPAKDPQGVPKAVQEPEGPRTVTGKVSPGSSEIRVTLSDGTALDFGIQKGKTEIVVGGKSALLSDVKTGDTVTVTFEPGPAGLATRIVV